MAWRNESLHKLSAAAVEKKVKIKQTRLSEGGLIIIPASDGLFETETA